MLFSIQLNRFMETLDVSASELARASGLSIATISRYKAGKRIPLLGKEAFLALAKGISLVAEEKHMRSFDEQTVTKLLADAILAEKEKLCQTVLQKNFSILLTELNIDLKHLAEWLCYDISHLYRIRNGQRLPGDPVAFAESLAQYVVTNHASKDDLTRITNLIGYPCHDMMESENGKSQCEEKLTAWLLNSTHGDSGLATSIFRTIEEFNLDQFLRSTPPAPLTTSPHSGTTKEFQGPAGMNNAINEFVLLTAGGTSSHEVTVYSDFPLTHDDDANPSGAHFTRRIIDLVNSGVHVNTIHRMDQSLHDTFIAFKLWLPLYMSGRITSYYIEDAEDAAPLFHHCFIVSGNGVFHGDGVVGKPETYLFSVSKRKEDIRKYSLRADSMMSVASRFFDSFGSDRKHEFIDLLTQDVATPGDRIAFLSAPPLHTISDALLDRMLHRHAIPSVDAKKIYRYVQKERQRIDEILSHDNITILLANPCEKELLAYPPNLFLSDVFVERSIPYTYADYLMHLDDTKKYAQQRDNYKVVLHDHPSYRNLRIMIHKNHRVYISSNKPPASHFVINHPKICYLIEQLEPFKEF